MQSAEPLHSVPDVHRAQCTVPTAVLTVTYTTSVVSRELTDDNKTLSLSHMTHNSYDSHMIPGVSEIS
jgi:hypothetical protein